MIADLVTPSANTEDAAGDSYDSIEDLSGSFYADVLRGNDAGNRLSGGTGDDRLFGRGGDDTFSGGLGNDVLNGAAGADDLAGGEGKDRYVFSDTAETGTSAATRDVITGFQHLIDTIDLSAIDAIDGGGNNAFQFIGGQAFTAAGQVRAFVLNGATIVELNTRGAGADAQIELAGFKGALSGADFIL